YFVCAWTRGRDRVRPCPQEGTPGPLPETTRPPHSTALQSSHHFHVRIERESRMCILPTTGLEHVRRLAIGVPEVPPHHPPDRLLARRALDSDSIAGLKPCRPEQRIDQQRHASGSSSPAA